MMARIAVAKALDQDEAVTPQGLRRKAMKRL
jgi:hypothetical protein